MSNVFIFTNGGKKSQRELVEDITSWYINTKLPRYKNLNIEIDLEELEKRAKQVDNITSQLKENESEVEERVDVNYIG